ncbi:DUF7793 family protein [Sorangium sp. So ce385]|uniref:DUF7793 family protein n=1 Tax=Sorangium sp. So ce385 TaxID=3133308 RepID=UPI003F5B2338
MKAREIVTSAQILRLEDDGIIRATAFPVHMSLGFAQEVVRATIELADGTPRPVLVDIRAQKTVDRAAREYFAGAEAAKGHCALALLVDSPVSKAIGNFFLGLSQAPVPRKLFTSEDEAIGWLRGFLR